jgi:hypothetical protein
MILGRPINMDEGYDDFGNNASSDILPHFETRSFGVLSQILSPLRFVDVLLVLCVFVGLVVAPDIAVGAVVVWIFYEFLH